MPTFDQDAFRARWDDGDETAASWMFPVNTAFNHVPELPFRVRFVVQESTTGVTDQDFKLQYRLNSGTWTDVTASSSVCQAANSTHFTDQTDTTQQVGSGTFVTPNSGMEDSDGAVPGVADFAGSDETELEFCVILVADDLKEDDVVDLRVVEADGTAFSTYTNTPAITVNGRYNNVDRTSDQVMGLQTFNRQAQHAVNLNRAFGVSHLRDGTNKDPAGTHVDPLVPAALGYVSVDADSGLCEVESGFALRGVSRVRVGEYILSFNSAIMRQRAGSNNLQVKVTPVDGVAWPFVSFTERGAVKVTLYAHPPRFFATLGSAQTTITEASDVKVQFDTERFDKGGVYDSATNYRFTAPVNGFYRLSYFVKVQDDASGGSDLNVDFRNYNASDVTPAGTEGAWNTFENDTETRDFSGDYNISTNVFTAPVAGLYELFAQVIMEDPGGSGITSAECRLYNTTDSETIAEDNATIVPNKVIAGTSMAAAAYAQVELAASDTVEAQYKWTDSVDSTPKIGGGAEITYFWGRLIRSHAGVSGGIAKTKKNGSALDSYAMTTSDLDSSASFGGETTVELVAGDYVEVFVNATADGGNLDIVEGRFNGEQVGEGADRTDLDFAVTVRSMEV